jgi:hypothetical protein
MSSRTVSLQTLGYIKLDDRDTSTSAKEQLRIPGVWVV